MNNTEATQNLTGEQIVEALRNGTMTKDEVVDLMVAKMAADREAPRTISFGKAPQGGWTEADRVAK